MGPKKTTTKSAFTLAEVLITLTVIGVVASLAVPTLMNNIQDAQLKAAWKKTYAELSQATNLIVKENGSFNNLCSDDNCFRNIYQNYLSYIKVCDLNQSNGNCWISNGRYLNGTEYNTVERPSLILSNGSFVRFGRDSVTCTPNGSYKRCGWINVDVNGFKPPNTVGKDIFKVHILNNKILPNGGYSVDLDDPAITCIPGSTDSTNDGEGCSAKYLYE